MNRIDAEQYKILKNEFERIRPMLMKVGREANATGAWARGMLTFVPALLLFVERERKIATPSRDVFDGTVNFFGDFLRHVIRITMTPAERLNAFEVMMRDFERAVRPKLLRTDGGIILPDGARLQ